MARPRARPIPPVEPVEEQAAGPVPASLQAELKKRNPFEFPEQEVMLNLMRTADLFSLQFARLFREHCITEPQYNILRILRGEGTAMPCLEIAGRMVTCVPDITRLIDRLEQAGLVGRDRSTQDRRVIFIRITPKGLDLLERLDAPVLDLHRRLVGHLSGDEISMLSRLLVKARHAPMQ